MVIRYLFNIFYVFTLLTFVVQSQGNRQMQPIILQYADSLVGVRGANNEIREFSGNVVLLQGDVTVECDNAVQYLNENRAVLSGNVHINQRELDLFTPRGVYYGNSKIASSFSGMKMMDGKTVLTAKEGTYSTETLIADFRNNVKIEDDSAIIYADRLIYHRKNKNSFAYGNVLIRGKYSNTYLLGDTLEHYPSKNITIVKAEPRLFQIDTIAVDSVGYSSDDSLDLDRNTSDSNYVVRLDTLSIKAKYMKSIIDSENKQEIYYFIDSVEFRQKELAAKADTAVYYKTAGKVELIGVPIVWYDSTQLYADSITIFLPDMKIKELRAIGNSIACSRDDTLDLQNINQVVGDEIIIKFENDSINAIFGFGNAKSLYFITEDSSGAGVQSSSCDSLIVSFDSGEVDKINWLGGVNGEFYPSHLIIDPKEFYLPGFRWSEAKPRKIRLSIEREDKHNKE